MTDPGWSLQKAIFSALDAALSVPVYDAVPQDAVQPYVVLASQLSVPDDPLNSRRDERHFYINVWSGKGDSSGLGPKGQRQALEIMGQIDAALHQARLPMDTGRMVRSYVVRKLSQPDIDGETWVGRVTVRVITEH